MSGEYAPQESFLIPYVLRAIPFRRYLPRFPILEPFHLFAIRHILSAVDVSDLEESIVTTAFVTTFRVRVELTLVIDQSDRGDNSLTVSIYRLEILELCSTREHEIFPVFPVKAPAIVWIRIDRFFDFSGDLISTCYDIGKVVNFCDDFFLRDFDFFFYICFCHYRGGYCLRFGFFDLYRETRRIRIVRDESCDHCESQENCFEQEIFFHVKILRIKIVILDSVHFREDSSCARVKRFFAFLFFEAGKSRERESLCLVVVLLAFDYRFAK